VVSRTQGAVKNIRWESNRLYHPNKWDDGSETARRSEERAHMTDDDLKAELESVNSKHQGRRTTREDIAYLTDLLKCANKKLIWEKQLASVQKRTPVILETVSRLMNDPQIPADEQLRTEMLRSLQAIQATMERLQSVKSD